MKQQYGNKLRSRTLASLKPEISQAKHSLLEEIASTDEAKVIHAETSTFRTNRYRRPHRSLTKLLGSISSCDNLCPFCKQSGRPDNHFLSERKFLHERHPKYVSKAMQIAAIFGCDNESDHESPADQVTTKLQ